MVRKNILLIALLSGLMAGCQSVGLALLNAMATGVRHTEVAYAPGNRGGMDLYSDKKASASPVPLIVFWYGGTWQTGKRADYRFVGAALASRGAVVAVPDYRLYPQVRFPVFLEDAAAAVARAQQEARAVGADPRRIVLGGHSSGAYIAAMLALQPDYLRKAGVDPASIAGFFGLSGPYALEPNSGALRDMFTAVATPAEFQPVQQVDDGAPPALLVHGEEDDVVYPSHTQRLATALRERGVQVELRLVAGRGHVDTVVALSRPGAFRIPDLVEEVSEFASRVAGSNASR